MRSQYNASALHAMHPQRRPRAHLPLSMIEMKLTTNTKQSSVPRGNLYVKIHLSGQLPPPVATHARWLLMKITSGKGVRPLMICHHQRGNLGCDIMVLSENKNACLCPADSACATIRLQGGRSPSINANCAHAETGQSQPESRGQWWETTC